MEDRWREGRRKTVSLDDYWAVEPIRNFHFKVMDSILCSSAVVLCEITSAWNSVWSVGVLFRVILVSWCLVSWYLINLCLVSWCFIPWYFGHLVFGQLVFGQLMFDQFVFGQLVFYSMIFWSFGVWSVGFWSVDVWSVCVWSVDVLFHGILVSWCFIPWYFGQLVHVWSVGVWSVCVWSVGVLFHGILVSWCLVSWCLARATVDVSLLFLWFCVVGIIRLPFDRCSLCWSMEKDVRRPHSSVIAPLTLPPIPTLDSTRTPLFM